MHDHHCVHAWRATIGATIRKIKCNNKQRVNREFGRRICARININMQKKSCQEFFFLYSPGSATPLLGRCWAVAGPPRRSQKGMKEKVCGSYEK
jgi:hypothetical protein